MTPAGPVVGGPGIVLAVVGGVDDVGLGVGNVGSVGPAPPAAIGLPSMAFRSSGKCGLPSRMHRFSERSLPFMVLPLFATLEKLDRSLLEAAAALKSLRPIERDEDEEPPAGGGTRNPDVDFHGQRHAPLRHRPRG